MSFSKRVLVGLIAGAATGLFLGDAAGVFKWPADAFVRLLQTTVFPYITISIINNLGRLEPHEAIRLAKRVGLVILGLWLVALLFAFLIPLSFPAQENASFFSTTLVEPAQPFDFLGQYVPSNPFYALANSVVPAIVLFSLLMGVALMTIDRKEAVLNVLAVAEAAVARATRMIMRLTPYGLFAITANAAGTIDVQQFGYIQVYLISYTVVGVLLGALILPGLIATFTPVTIRELFARTHDSLLMATMAGDVFIVLPSLIDGSKDLLRHHEKDQHVPDLPEVIVPTSYNLPHSGKLLSLSFILFAAWYADSPLSRLQFPRLAVTGLVSFFGSINVAVPFLLDAFKVPADTFQLFVAMSVVNSRVGSFIAAVHTVAVAVLGSAAVAGQLRIEPRRILRFGIVSLVSTVLVIGGLRVLFATVLAHPFTKTDVILSMRPLSQSVPTVVRDAPPPEGERDHAGSVMDGVMRHGFLRVCYAADSIPFVYQGSDGTLIGHDVDLARMMASELGVTLEFVPTSLDTFVSGLNDGACDIAMSGVPVTTLLARDVLFSASYMDETLAFVVPDSMRQQFSTWESIHSLDPLTISVVNLPYYVDRLALLAPNARLVRVRSVTELFRFQDLQVDAAIFTAERGSSWTLLHPELSVVVPQPNPIKIPLAFGIGRRDVQMEAFVNSWIELKRNDGTLDRLYRHWILGADAVERGPRWSIMRNVLHWVK